jgi:putative hydrolase of the HAD superfamily
VITTVFFDAGETLVHPHPSFAELFSDVLRGEGVSVDAARIQERVPVVAERFRAAADRNEGWSTDPGRSKAFWLDVYRLFLRSLGAPDDPALAGTLYEAFSDHANYALFDDVRPSLEALAAAGLGLGLISNFEDWLEVLLERLDVTRYFPVRVISGIEGIEKPDPHIFRIALDRAGVVPHDAAYVGDNPEFDVAPAAEVGMFPVLLDRHDRYADGFAGPPEAPRITSLRDLPAIVGA